MSAWDTAADVATVVTGVAAVWTAGVWTLKQYLERRERQADKRIRGWPTLGRGSISEWLVRLAEDPAEPTSRVVLEVIDRDGRLAPNQAHTLRQTVRERGGLARCPTAEEHALIAEVYNRGAS
jgi:hypothetical protein